MQINVTYTLEEAISQLKTNVSERNGSLLLDTHVNIDGQPVIKIVNSHKLCAEQKLGLIRFYREAVQEITKSTPGLPESKDWVEKYLASIEQ